MNNSSQIQSNIELLAEQAFKSIAPTKYNQLHLFLDGLIAPLTADITRQEVFKNENSSGEHHA